MLVLILKNWTFRKMVKAQLEEEGYNVFDFQSTDDAYDFIDNNLRKQDRLFEARYGSAPMGCIDVSNRIGLIVIDLMDGGYTIRGLKNIRERAGGASVLVLKGAAGLADNELKKNNFNFILRRPFSIGHLVDEVKNVLDKIPR